MKRTRTAAGVLEIIKLEDPGSEITLHFIRQTILSGAVPMVEVGRRKLVDADALIEYMTAGREINTAPYPEHRIMRIPSHL